MRRPAQTTAQRKHAREQRVLLRLRKASVRYKHAIDLMAVEEDVDDAIAIETELHGAALAYADTLTARERRKLVR